MLKVAMFEDQPELLIERGLSEQLEGHELVAQATTLGESFDVLKRMALGDLEVDAVLLDANLAPEHEAPVFMHEMPIDESKIRTNWRGKIKMPRPEIVTVRGLDYMARGYCSAKAVVDVMQQTGLTAKLIGISGDSMSSYGLEEAMYADITKSGIPRLGSVLSTIENGSE